MICRVPASAVAIAESSSVMKWLPLWVLIKQKRMSGSETIYGGEPPASAPLRPVVGRCGGPPHTRGLLVACRASRKSDVA